MSSPSPSTPFLTLSGLYLTAQSLPLLLTPRLALTLLTATTRTSPPTDLETHLSRSLALPFLILAGLVAAEVVRSISQSESESENRNQNQGIAAATGPSHLVPALTALHGLSMLHSYVSYSSTRYSSFGGQGASAPGILLLDVAASGFLAVYGLWVLMFGFGPGHISRRTGRDKRVSGWPLGKGDRERKKGR